MGGKAPVIVFDDADIDAVVNGLRAFGYYNAGQDCTAACRIYAGKKVYEKLVAELSSAVSTIKFGQADDTANEIGPLISKRQRDGWRALSSEQPSRSTWKSPPAASRAKGRASSTSPRSSPARCRAMRSCGAKCSAPLFR